MLFRTLVFSFGLATLAASAALAASSGNPGLPPQPKTRPAGMPADAVMVSPCVRAMGNHWANPKNLPFGPIYGTYNGRPVFTEIMIDKKDFAAGRSYDDALKPLPGYRIDHVDVDYVPYGHAGYPIPHYDIHAYYVPHAVHETYCPNGERELMGPNQP
jgi:hypothetical protein